MVQQPTSLVRHTECARQPRRPTGALAARFVAAASAAIVAIGLGASPADAQVNIEKIRVGAEQPGWGGTLDMNAALHRGNTKRDVIGSGVRLQYAWPRSDADADSAPADGEQAGETKRAAADDEAKAPNSVAFLTSNYSFTRFGDSRFVNNALSHLRFIRQYNSRFAYEVFAQHQFNEFIRLNQRLLFGGGGRFALLRGRQTEVFVGAGYMLERETLDLLPDNPDPRRSKHHRSTNYVTIRYNTVDERIRFVHTTYAQTRVDRLDDFRLLAETSFEIQLFRQLALAINLNVVHDSEPPTGVKETDLVLSNSLRYSF